ncbi:MAG: aminopeptidase P family protein [Bacteroidota bacterium]
MSIASPHAARLRAVRSLLPAHEAEACLLTATHDLRWAVGFTGSNGLLVLDRHQATFLTDGRYEEQAQHEVHEARIVVVQGDLIAHAMDQGMLPEGAQAVVQGDHLTVAAWKRMHERAPGVRFVPVSGLVAPLVAAKTPGEIECVRAAQAVTDAVFEEIVTLIQPGMTERELAAEITYGHLRRGASAMSFDPIVASGPNSALPHARPTDRAFEQDDVILIDMGAYVDGYSSDMTRTVVLGSASADVQAVYEAVHLANESAIGAARAGMSGKALDTVARDVLNQAGYEAFFTHSLGHGVGLQVHEWPRLSQQVEHTLPAGATVTIEPGVYLPGRFGVRIEDIVALRDDGCDTLTASPKALLEL